jgi:hypothetical protein
LQNQFILNIKVRDGWNAPAPIGTLDGYFFIILSLGILNLILEWTIRRFIPVGTGDLFIQISHILIFFFYPSYLFLKSWKKTLGFSFFLFLTIMPVYYLILNGYVSFYFSFFFIFCWISYLIFFRNNKRELKSIIFGLKNNILLAVLVGLLFCLHLSLVIWLSQTFLPSNIDLAKVLTNLFLEANFSLLGMEFFFRYFLCLRLIERNGFSFLAASSLSTVLFILPFLTNPIFNQSTAMIIGFIYYGLMQGFTSCWLAYKTKSLLPSIIFGLVLTVFLSLIF